MVSTLAGSGTIGTADGIGVLAQFTNPVNVVVDAIGTVFVADFSDDNPGRIRAVTPEGVVSTLFTQDSFRRPFGLALAGSTLYVTTDRDGSGTVGISALWQIDTLNGEGTLRLSTINDGRERGIVVREDGILVMADRANHVLIEVDLTTDPPTVTPWVGQFGVSGFANGQGEAALFNQPYGLGRLGDGIIVADSGNHCLRQVMTTGEVTTLAGICGTAGYGDGESLSAQFNGPQDVTVSASGTIYVTDVQNHRIRAVLPNGTVETLAGSGIPGFADGEALQAQFFGQEGLEMFPGSSVLYVADGNGGNESEPFARIRQIQLSGNAPG
ncbi:MAG: hypothetical protein OHK0012_17310 [Synechococcales cyanobacterium]